MKKIKHLIVVLIISLALLPGCSLMTVEALNHVTLTKLSVQSEKLYLMGDFNSKSYDQVKEVVETHPNIDTIVLTANPGSLDDETTFKLARYIRDRKLNTHLLDQSVIASGAVDLFLAGVNRTMEKGAMLGVHSWSDGLRQAKDIPRNHPDHALNANYIKDMLGCDEFYWFTIYAAPAKSIYWMKTGEIERYRLLTGVVLAASHEKTPFGEEFRIQRKDVLEN